MRASHSYAPIRSIARAMSGQGTMGTVSMQGYSTTSAPRSRSRPARVPARSLGRVTTTRLPFRGSLSNQSNRSPRAHTLPKTLMAGAPTRSAAAFSARVAAVASTRRCMGVVPCSTMDAGVSGSIPAATSPAQMALRLVTPMRNTRVPPVRTRASKSMSRGFPSRAWPVMMWSEEVKSRWVTGMPP